MTYHRSCSYAGNGVAFACIESSDEPLPLPSVPGVGQAPRVELTEAERTAFIQHAHAAQIDRTNWAASLHQSSQEDRAADIAALQHQSRLEIGR